MRTHQTTRKWHWRLAFDVTTKSSKSPFKNSLISNVTRDIRANLACVRSNTNSEKRKCSNRNNSIWHLAWVPLMLDPNRPSRFDLHRHFLGICQSSPPFTKQLIWVHMDQAAFGILSTSRGLKSLNSLQLQRPTRQIHPRQPRQQKVFVVLTKLFTKEAADESCGFSSVSFIFIWVPSGIFFGRSILARELASSQNDQNKAK